MLNDISYYEAAKITDDYQKERCVLDIYYPANIEDFATVVWFHGGGIKMGEKFVPKLLMEQGFAVVAVNYRLYPKVKKPVYLEDAAAAVAWTIKNIGKYDGDSLKVFVSGHSAGGYLTSMVGLDKSFLAEFGVDADILAGLIPFSGHTITHFTVREEMGIPGEQAIVDEYAPLYHAKKDTPPILLITGDRELELLGRYEETAYFYRMMKVNGNESTELIELQGFDHGTMVNPACFLLIEFVEKYSK
ncbi:MAG: lipase [Melioribacteraceae bacterium]|nr:MAG: lipase [Melioribacteraceae bacterium]